MFAVRTRQRRYDLSPSVVTAVSDWMAGYRTFLFPGGQVDADSVVLDPRESHHLVRVLRAQRGDAVHVLDGNGTVREGKLEHADAKAARIGVRNELHFKRPDRRLVLVQAVPKGKAMDLVLRMATEIGVAAICPIFSAHGEVQLSGERLATKVDKWRLTMIESCKQCGLPFLPELHSPLGFEAWRDATWLDGAVGLVASLEADSCSLKAALGALPPSVRELVLAVGPEGDFSADEYAALRTSGFAAVRLGAYVLRAETAAAYLLSVTDQFLRE